MSPTKKIVLQRSPIRGTCPPGHKITHVHAALPFYKSRRGPLTHRVRSGHNHWRHGKLSHISLTMWCGAHGFTATTPAKGDLLPSPPIQAQMCAFCEVKAKRAERQPRHRRNPPLGSL
jgi:hypothetical protein